MKLRYISVGVPDGTGRTDGAIVTISGWGLCEATVRNGRVTSTIERSHQGTIRRIRELGAVEEVLKRDKNT
jgi:hypothetical protein